MKFAIITHVPHLIQQNQYFAYAPYVREMNIWSNFVGEFIIVAPEVVNDKSSIDEKYNIGTILFYKIPQIDIISSEGVLNTIFKSPKIFFKIIKAMRNAEHIHLRCPGNMGLLGCFVQILFPSKPKTAKYAGNWDPKSSQPWSYRLQKWILNNSFLTRNMKVLVYGEWEGQSKNIVPFFTASYSENDKKPYAKRSLHSTIEFVFAGTLSPGKNPLYAVRLVNQLHSRGKTVHLSIYGEGPEKSKIEEYIAKHSLEEVISLQGNQDAETLKTAYQRSHFVILASQSEGWPKVIAEGMFWGAVPLATPVSCVPKMLNYGTRGILLEMDLNKDTAKIVELINDQQAFDFVSKSAFDWSQQYTTEVFEREIKKILED